MRFLSAGLRLGILPLIFLLVSCFGGVSKTGKVVGYEPGRVLTKLGSYQVGDLPPDWRQLKLGKALIAFYNDELKSTIATDAFCERAYDDSPLDMLTKHLFAGLQDVKIVSEKPLMLGDRGALHTSFSGSLDGLPVRIDTVIVKKDWCLFDFYLVSQPDFHERALAPFETFFRGFAYTGEI